MPSATHPDAPHPSGDDRYAIYKAREAVLHRLCETSREGIGLAIETMLDEGEVPRGWRIGILDREARRWLVDPFV